MAIVQVDELIRKAQELSPLPTSVIQLARLAGSPETDLEQIVDVMAYDQALTMRLLRAANAVTEASSDRILLARDAIFRLGSGRILALAIAASVQPILRQNAAGYGMGEGVLWRHSTAAACAAEMLPEFTSQEIPVESLTAALLHDVGKLVMGRFLSPDDLDFIRRGQSEGGLTPLEAERQLLRIHHGELGGIVAQHWQLPDRIVKGIIYHHEPAAGCDRVCDVVYLANLVAKQLSAPEEQEINADNKVLERLGLTSHDLLILVNLTRDRFKAVSARYDAM